MKFLKIKKLTKSIHLFLVALFLLCGKINYAQTNKAAGPSQLMDVSQLQNRGCATGIPTQQWEAKFQEAIAQYLAQNPQQAKLIGNNSAVMAGYSIPVIMHVIHGGQAIGTFPNLAQGQLNSQVTVLANDYGGTGQNIGNYPATAFQAYATNTLISAASKDALGRIGIKNCNINFCLATKDTLGNILAEPGIHRVNYNTLPATANPSKNPAAANYNTPALFTNFINSYIKPNTIWNVGKYLNIWVTDENASVGLLGYATFPPLSTLIGIPGSLGTALTDGFWSYAGAFGSSTIFPGGSYAAPYDKGRTCTHEIGHWLGLRHTGGDVANGCATDYCNDTPPSRGCNNPCGNGFGLNFGSPAYPFHANMCAGPPANVNGDMFMNFMDYTDDLAMYMFTEDQRVRMHVAMQNSPYRKFLGTHNLCNLPAPLSNFSVAPTTVCQGAVVNIGDLSLNVPTSWSYTMTGGTPASSSVQNPTVSYSSPGVYTISMVATNAAGSSTVAVKTVTVISGPAFALTSNPAATVCAGNNVTITPSGATTYTLVNTGATAPPFIVTPTVATVYSVTAITSGTNTCPRTQTLGISIGTINVNITPTVASVCAGQSVLLTGSGATTYTWSTGSNAVSVNVTPTATATYTLNGTSSGCSGTKTVQVTVNPIPTLTANNTTICAGGTATLTAGGANTYTWSTAATTSVINVSPVINTVYTFTGTSAFGCINTKTVSVTIGTGLGIVIIATPTVLCIGSSATLTASGASTYTWNTSQNGPSIVVTPTVAGTANYTVNGSSGACNGTKTISVVVSALPTTAVAGPNQTICISNPSTTVIGNTPIIGTGTWSLIAGFGTITNSTSATTNITGIATAGLNIFRWRITNGACSSMSTLTIQCDALPTAAAAIPAQTVCGTVANLTGNAPTVGTGLWSLISGTGSISSPNSASTGLTGLGLGTSVFQWSISNGMCAPSSSSASVTATNGPTVTAVTATSLICAGSPVNLTASGATTYSWNTGATTAVISVSPLVTTNYTVTGTVGPCSSSTVISQAVSPCTGVSQVASAVYDVVVYPNPFKEELTVSAGELVNAQVFNTLGQLIIVKTINGIGTINTSEIAKGVYYVNVKGINGSKTLKIVKE